MNANQNDRRAQGRRDASESINTPAGNAGEQARNIPGAAEGTDNASGPEAPAPGLPAPGGTRRTNASRRRKPFVL